MHAHARDGALLLLTLLVSLLGVACSGELAARGTSAPDAGRIAFESDRDGHMEIYVMGIDGANQARLTNNPASDANPVWSPDGKTIVFHSMRDGNREL